MISVTWTDMIQCCMVGGGALLFFIALHKIPGGWSAARRRPTGSICIARRVSVAPFLGIIFGTFGVFVLFTRLRTR